MYDETIPFEFMGVDHFVSIVVFIILCFTIPFFAKTRLNEKQQHFVGIIIGSLVLFSYLSWVLLEIAGGTFSLKLHLPFHLCRAANILVFF